MSKRTKPKMIKHKFPTFNLKLNNEQIEAKKELMKNDISIIVGKAGSGKCVGPDTLLDIYVDENLKKKIESFLKK